MAISSEVQSWKAVGMHGGEQQFSLAGKQTREGWKMRLVPDGGRRLVCISNDRGSQEEFLRSGVL